MDTHDYHTVTAHVDASSMNKVPIFNLSSGYIQRSQQYMPKMGTTYPWVYYQNYLYDIVQLRYKSIVDEYVEFK